MKPFIIGVAGGSGSGKSTFARQIVDSFSEYVNLIHCDNYYNANDDMTYEERTKLNYDSPESIEFTLMEQHIRELRDGHDIVSPIYDFTIHNRKKETFVVEAKPVIVIDGILILTRKELRDLMDLKIFIETDADERILRRARRDMVERQRSLDSVINQYLATVKPMHNAYVEPSKQYADIIVNGGMNVVAADVVKSRIKEFLTNIPQ